MKKNGLTSEIAFFGNVKVLAVTGLLAALSFVLASIAKSVFGPGPLRLTFENLPIFIGSFSFGPAIGGVIALCADLLACLVNGMAPIPLITVGAVLVGAVSGILYGYVLKKAKNEIRISVSAAFAHLIGSAAVKTYALYEWYGSVVLFRIPIYIGTAAIESFLLILLFRNKEFSRQLDKIKNGK